MALVTGFQDVQNSVLIKVVDEQYGHIPIVAELLDRFTTLADNWSELNKQAMDAVKAKNDVLDLISIRTTQRKETNNDTQSQHRL